MTAPADELRAAADQLHTLADNATPGPWVAEPAQRGATRSEWVNVGQRRYDPIPEPDAAFIAAMSPDFARAVATWLRAEAMNIEAADPESPVYGYAALAVARAVPPTGAPR